MGNGLYLILMGVQGAGKGEQAKVIAREYGIPHVSTGDLFRAMFKRSDDFAERIKSILNAGNLVDDDTTNEVVRERLSQPDAANGVILDGYPRTPSQAEWLEQHLAAKGEKIAAVLLFKLDLYVAFKRAFGRVSDSAGNTYNIYFNDDGIATVEQDPDPNKHYPPRVKVTLKNGEIAVRRADDADAAAVIKRIDTYIRETAPLIAHFQTKGLLREIDADRTIEAVSADLQHIIDHINA
jgi:adenylate kinase